MKIESLLEKSDVCLHGGEGKFSGAQFYAEHVDAVGADYPLESEGCTSMREALSAAAEMFVRTGKPVHVRMSVDIEHADGDVRYLEYVEVVPS